MKPKELDRHLRDTHWSILNDYRLKLQQAQSAGIAAAKLISAECLSESEYLETLTDVFKPRTRTK
jgi:hypothetical protein